MDRLEGFPSNLAPGEPAPPASGELFAGHEVAALVSFLDNIATENEFLFHPKVPASLSWDGFHTTKNQGFEEFKHSALQWGSDTHFSSNGYVATHKYVPVGYGHVHPQSSAQRSARSSQSSRAPSRRLSTYSGDPNIDTSPYQHKSTMATPARGSDLSVAAQLPPSTFDFPSSHSAVERTVRDYRASSSQYRSPSTEDVQHHESTEPESDSKRIKMEDGSKAPLTAAQKRQNHISSEQKRRNLIKVGFSELSNIIPSVVGNASKSTILHEAIAFIKSNNAHLNDLRQKIERLKAEV